MGQVIQQAAGVGADQAVALAEVIPQQAALPAAAQGDFGGERQVGDLLQADVLQQQSQQGPVQQPGNPPVSMSRLMPCRSIGTRMMRRRVTSSVIIFAVLLGAY